MTGIPTGTPTGTSTSTSTAVRMTRRTGRLRVLAVLLPALPALPLPAGAQTMAQTVAVVSQQGARVSRIEAGSVTAAWDVAQAPAVAVADASGRLYVSHPDGQAITVIEPGSTPRRLAFAGQAFGLAVEPDGRALYVGDWSGNRVLRIAPATGAVDGAAAVGRNPAGLVLGEGNRLYVAEREARSVGVIDTERMERIAGLHVGEGPFALAYDPVRRRVYVANVRSDDVTVIDALAGRVLAQVPAGASPYGVAVSADGARVVVTDQHAAAVSVIDAETLSVVATLPVGQYPEGVAILDGQAYVANWFSDDVTVIDLAHLRVTGRIGVAAGPRSILALPAAAVPGTPLEGPSKTLPETGQGAVR